MGSYYSHNLYFLHIATGYHSTSNTITEEVEFIDFSLQTQGREARKRSGPVCSILYSLNIRHYKYRCLAPPGTSVEEAKVPDAIF